MAFRATQSALHLCSLPCVPPVSSVVKNFAGENQQKHYHPPRHSPTIGAIQINQRLVLSQRHLRLNLIFTMAPASCGRREVRLREKYLWRYK